MIKYKDNFINTIKILMDTSEGKTFKYLNELSITNFDQKSNKIIVDSKEKLLSKNEENDSIILLNLLKSNLLLTLMLESEDFNTFFIKTIEEMINYKDDEDLMNNQKLELKKMFYFKYNDRTKLDNTIKNNEIDRLAGLTLQTIENENNDIIDEPILISKEISRKRISIKERNIELTRILTNLLTIKNEIKTLQNKQELSEEEFIQRYFESLHKTIYLLNDLAPTMYFLNYKLKLFKYEKNVERTIQIHINSINNIIEFLTKFNMRLVLTKAKEQFLHLNTYMNQIDFHDLKNEGVVGFINAIHNIVPNSGFKISTYVVWWINQYIKEYIDDNKYDIKIPQQYFVIYSKYEKLLETHQIQNVNVSFKEIAKKMELSEKKLKEILGIVKNYQKAQNKQQEDDYDTIDSIVTENMDYEEKIDFEKRKQLVFDNLDLFNEREQYLLYMKNIFDSDKKELNNSLEDIGHRLGLTKERIRQVEMSCERKIKKILARHNYF